MFIVNRVIEPKRVEEIYRERYKIFVERDRDAPAELYKNGLLKDDCDDYALHIACYNTENSKLVGFLTVVPRASLNGVLPVEEQHDVLSEDNSAEIMRLIILDELNIKDRGRVLGLLLAEVEKIVLELSLTKLYLVTTAEAQKIYQRIGFEQIGPYKLYKGVSNECPMALEIENINKKFFKGVNDER